MGARGANPRRRCSAFPSAVAPSSFAPACCSRCRSAATGSAAYDVSVAEGRSTSWTPDEIIVAAEILRANDWRDLRETDPEVVALSELLRRLPAHADSATDPRFRSPGSVSRKLTDLYTAHPAYPGPRTKGGETTRRIAEAFAANPDELSRIAQVTRDAWEKQVSSGAVDDLAGIEAYADEGRAALVTHLRRERDPKLRAEKLREALRRHGRIACQVCEFDFHATYGDRGRDFIEVHHVVPLHESGETTTGLADLALLCSNCHRMIHRRVPWLTPDELRELVRRAA